MHVEFVYPAPVMVNDRFGGVPVGARKIVRDASVKRVDAVPDGAVAATEYAATNQFGRLNWSAMFPDASAVTSTLRDQELPKSSFTKMWTDSPGCQFEPVRVTRPPGG